MTATTASYRGPGILVLLVCVLAPPVGLLLWVFTSGAHRPAFLASVIVRVGLGILLVGSAPLVAIIILAGVGLWPDPNPNPIGPGLLFFFSAVAGTLCLAIGVFEVWRRLRAG